MKGTYPASLKDAIAHLEANPRVVMRTLYASVATLSRWQYVEVRDSTIWFKPAMPRRGMVEAAQCGLELRNHECEIGFDFYPRGFLYVRGKISIAVEYFEEVPI